jgi:WhiB family redox-sensing transcriptional regulator
VIAAGELGGIDHIDDIDDRRIEQLRSHLQRVENAIEAVLGQRAEAEVGMGYVAVSAANKRQPQEIVVDKDDIDGIKDTETRFIVDVMRRTPGGGPLKRNAINDKGYNRLVVGRSVEASNQAFRLRIERLVAAGVIVRESPVSYRLADDIELIESDAIFLDRVIKMLDENTKLSGGWAVRGNCLSVNPDLMYPGRGEDETPAKAVCIGCPVKDECLVNAVRTNEKEGVLGGMSGRERRTLKKEHFKK